MPKYAWILLPVLFLFIIWTIILPSETEDSRPTGIPSAHAGNPPNNKDVLIFAATKFFGTPVSETNFLSACTSTRGHCKISSNASDFEKADAVLFHNADFLQFSMHPRKPDVPYILWSLESPSNDIFRPTANFINWTMYFRREADIWYPYGRIVKRQEKVEIDFDALWNEKTVNKSSVWIGSNCNAANRRQDLIDELQKLGLKADVFGKCGVPVPKDCDGVTKQGFECTNQVVREYKFYLAFENSNCVDYVTEKFFLAVGPRNAVPIVGKRKYYEDLKVPPSSFIAVDDFPDLRSLVAFVSSLAESKEQYLKFHEWRQEYEVLTHSHDSWGFCELCRRLQSNDRPSKSYANLIEWQFSQRCDDKFFLKYLIAQTTVK